MFRLLGSAKCLEGAASVVGYGGIAGLQPCRTVERCEGGVMLAELPEASREVDLRRGIPRQERRGTLQRLVGLGEAAEFQA